MLCLKPYKVVPDLFLLTDIIYEYKSILNKYNIKYRFTYIDYSILNKLFSLKANFDGIYLNLSLNFEYNLYYYDKCKREFYKIHYTFIKKIRKMYNENTLSLESILYKLQKIKKIIN